ncbi:hypothetical protein, partial [Bacillus subtilis]
SIEPELKTTFGNLAQDANQQALSALNLADSVFVSGHASVTPVDYVRVFTQAINRYGELGEQTSHRLEGMMQTQIQERRYAQYLLLAGLFAVALLAILLAVMI